MPVSHLALTVSHVPSATSFYLAALQPLGYRYIGQRGHSVGLGVEDADFFLAQENRGYRISPTHIAFSADSRLSVRNCYSAALNAGGRPSGAPSYCDDEGTAFNAAVEDLDGNTIEFIFHERNDGSDRHNGQPFAFSQSHNRPSSWDRDFPGENETRSTPLRPTFARSRAKTSMNDRSYAPERPEVPLQGIRRVQTAPVTPSSEFPSKKMFGTILGAAAGAAVAYAMTRSEQQSRRDEEEFASSIRGKSRRDARSRGREPDDYFEAARPRSNRQNRSIKQSAYGDESDVVDSFREHLRTQRPNPPRRSQTYDADEYTSAPKSHHPRRHTARSSTTPENRPHYYIEAPPPAQSTVSSRHTARRSNSERQPKLKRRDSGVSMQSHRSRQSHGTPESSYRRSSVSTIKPSRRGYERPHAADIPLPLSRTTSRAQSYVSTAKPPPILDPHENRWSETPEEESDGLDDMRTVVPEDSISCVDFSSRPSPPQKTRSLNEGSFRLEELRSETPNERVSRLTSSPRGRDIRLPTRGKDEGRSSGSQAWW